EEAFEDRIVEERIVRHPRYTRGIDVHHGRRGFVHYRREGELDLGRAQWDDRRSLLSKGATRQDGADEGNKKATEKLLDHGLRFPDSQPRKPLKSAEMKAHAGAG